MKLLFKADQDPLENFNALFAEAEKAVIKDVNAMSLATVSEKGFPRVRVVLFKGLVRGGFSFYTNYQSPKAEELVLNSRASLLFFWSALDVQIRIEGTTAALSPSESDRYFASRPRLSQIGAWASHQSEQISDLQELEARVARLEIKYDGQEIPRPPFWGGYHVLPLKIEFWFGRTGRLHERYVFDRSTVESPWTSAMLSP